MRTNCGSNASKLLLGIALITTAIGCAPARYYGGDTFDLSVSARGERNVLLSYLGTRLPGSSVSRISVAVDGQQIEVKAEDFANLELAGDPRRATLAGVPLPSLAAVRVGLSEKTRGAELDLLLECGDDSVIPVTLLHDPDGSLSIKQGTSRLARRPETPQGLMSPAEMKARYGIGPSDFGQVQWTPEYLAVLAQALALLGPEERAFLASVPIVREHKPSGVFIKPQFQQHVMALFTHTYGVARIELYDTLLDDDQRLFVGSPDAPLQRSVMYVLHEFGHVIATASHVSVLRDLTKSIDKYYDRIDELAEKNSAPDGTIRVTPEEDADLDNKLWDIETSFDRLERMGRSGPVIAAYRGVRGKGPTPYGAVSLHESFAEAFALFRADPEALRRVDPTTYHWFERGAHMKALSE